MRHTKTRLWVEGGDDELRGVARLVGLLAQHARHSGAVLRVLVGGDSVL